METNVIYNEDCLEGMEKLPDNSVDLVITSPPYNLGNDFHSNSIRYKSYEGDDMKEKQYQDWQVEILNECYRVLKISGSMWYNHKIRIKNKEIIHPINWIQKSSFIIKQEVVWNQRKGANVDKRRCFPFSERIWWLTKSKETKLYNKNNRKDVWNIVPTHNRKDFNHPAVMAKEVAEWIYELHDNDNIDIVLDPFAGVGTTFLPAIDRGIDFIGYELDKDYIKTAKERFEKPAQQQLF